MTSKKNCTQKLEFVFNYLIGKFIHHTKRKPSKKSFTNDALFEHTQYQLNKTKKHHDPNTHHKCHYRSFSSSLSTTAPLPPSSSSSPPLSHNQIAPCCCRYSPNTCHSRRRSYHCHHSPCLSTSDITIHSEDLTSKEFADMVGIQILSESIDDRQKVKTPSLIATSSKISSSTLLKESDGSSMFYPTSDILSLDDEEDHEEEMDETIQIWDNGFWQHPNKSANETLSSLHDMIRYDGTMCIKRGRFEILLTDNCTSSATIPPKRSDRMVLEWKRRKAACHSTS
ncbi:hypothetical protein BD560DRAFT_425047 [Blakeslea trispora]|nr:hypothetical protein BD560DRAFT_425047 [Blakeslea trispora]